MIIMLSTSTAAPAISPHSLPSSGLIQLSGSLDVVLKRSIIRQAYTQRETPCLHIDGRLACLHFPYVLTDFSLPQISCLFLNHPPSSLSLSFRPLLFPQVFSSLIRFLNRRKNLGPPLVQLGICFLVGKLFCNACSSISPIDPKDLQHPSLLVFPVSAGGAFLSCLFTPFYFTCSLVLPRRSFHPMICLQGMYVCVCLYAPS